MNIITKMNDQAITFKPKRFENHVKLYCCFGDIHGATDEDGIILDKTFVETSNLRKLQSVTLNIFIVPNLEVAEDPKMKFRYSYRELNFVDERSNILMFGILVSNMPLKLRRSKNVIYFYSKIGKSHFYNIYIREFSQAYKFLKSFCILEQDKK